jgi:hypothetical protein
MGTATSSTTTCASNLQQGQGWSKQQGGRELAQQVAEARARVEVSVGRVGKEAIKPCSTKGKK